MTPVQSLQHMLNHLSRPINTLPRLSENGIFDEATLEAVMIFQRDFGLPVTGIVDQSTWDTVAALYYDHLLQFGPPPPLHVFPTGTSSVGESEQAAEIRIAQAIFSELGSIISNFEVVEYNGINSGAVFRNLQTLQQLASLPVSGVLDRRTWAVLSSLYRTYITRAASRTFHLSD